MLLHQILFHSIEPSLYVFVAWSLWDTNIPFLPRILFSVSCILSLFQRIIQVSIIYFYPQEKKEDDTCVSKRHSSSFYSRRMILIMSCRDEIGIGIGSHLMPMLFILLLCFSTTSTSLPSEKHSTLYILTILVSWLGISLQLCFLYTTLSTRDAYFHTTLFIVGMSVVWVVLLQTPSFSITTTALSFKDSCFFIMYTIIQVLLLLVYDHGFIHTILTRGEWMVLSILLSILISDYCCFVSFSWFLLDTQELTCRVRDETVDHHLRIAQAGFVGCLSGCLCISWKPMRDLLLVLASTMAQGLIRIKQNWISTYSIQPIHNNHDTIYPSSSDTFLGPVVSLILHGILVGIHIMIAVFLSLHSLSCGSSMPSLLDVPLEPIYWLIDFLGTREGQFAFLTQSQTVSIPRYFWLIYWVIVLLVAIPPAVHLAQYISTRPMPQKRKLVVVSRKYFHFIAVVLFGPPTYFAPRMMSFSYAVSLSLLLMVECIRYGTLTQKKSPLHSPPGLKSNGNHQVETCKETSDAVNALNDFFNAFLGDHDTSNAFVVTHIFLIFGCAFPLWWYLLWSPLFRFDPLLPYIGIITLGIGDSFGAIFGVLIGRNCWPRSKRTLEGSMSMFFSMQISITILQKILTGRHVSLDACLYTSLPITLLEACTSQIDNLYLPLMATGLMMLETIR